MGMQVDLTVKAITGGLLAMLLGLLTACADAPGTLAGGDLTSQSLTGTAERAPEETAFAFEPFDGIPVNIGDALLRELGSTAEQYRIRVVPRSRDTATYRVRGYLLASSDDSASIISYVYDIYDRDGRRVHRISGRELGSASPGDPWSGVADGTVQQIAIQSLIALRDWLYAR